MTNAIRFAFTRSSSADMSRKQAFCKQKDNGISSGFGEQIAKKSPQKGLIYKGKQINCSHFNTKRLSPII